MRRLGIFLALVAGLLLPSRDARAVDAFEIQVYDGTANAPRQPGLELHVNGVPQGVTVAEAPELPPNHQTHLTLEPALGLTRTWEVGAYLETAVLPDGGFAFAGGKLRSKLVTPPGWRPSLRLGCNLEISWVRALFEADRWGAEVRPIVAWEDRRWLFAVNPIVEVALSGGAPAFAPAMMALVKIRELVSLGLEYYGDLGPFTSFSPAGGQQHYLFEVVNVLAWSDFELNAGIGEGLSSGSNDLVAKAIFGYRFQALPRW